MGNFKIVRAKRANHPLLISLWGGAFTGKTYSALRVARGLVGKKGRIGLIDTENRRSLHYADLFGGWDHLPLEPPFTPDRYVQAFQTFENAGGYDCIIIDSASHVWDGEGGVLDQADTSSHSGLLKWAAPKSSFRRMFNVLLRSPFHVFFLLRAKNGVAQEGRGNKTRVLATGLEPIFDKNGIYEMTISILLKNDHTPMFSSNDDRFWCNRNIPSVKAPSDILSAIKPGEPLTEEVGNAIRCWARGGEQDVKGDARRVAYRGTDAFRGWWKSRSSSEKNVLASEIDELKCIASGAD